MRKKRNMQIEITFKKAIVAGVVLLALSFAVAMYSFSVRSRYENQIADLQNRVAARDKTIETQKGIYEKLTIQSKDLEQLLGDKDAELTSLKDLLKKQGADLLTANTIIVQLKKELESIHTGPVTPDENIHGAVVVKIDTRDDFDPFHVTGEAWVNCEALTSRVGLKLSQLRQIRFSVVVSQDKNKTWKSSATSNVDNFDVDIALAAVNPYFLEPKWYEKIGMNAEIGVGTSPGFLAGVGVSYQIKKFEFGPKAWFVADPHGIYPYFGAQLTWHPFQNDR